MDRDLAIALKEIRQRISRVDPLLVRLINLAHGTIPIQYGVSVRLGGATISGIPAPSDTTGEILDKQTLRFVQIMHAMSLAAGHGEGTWPEIEGMIREARTFLETAKDEDNADSRLMSYMSDNKLEQWPKIADLPDELVDDAISTWAPPKAFTLTNATIMKDNGRSEEIGNIRINLASVEAWWTFDLGVPEGTQDALAQIQQAGGNQTIR